MAAHSSGVQRWIAAGCPEPRAADERVDGQPCAYEDCDRDADFRVAWDNGALMYCCRDCSQDKHIHVEGNGLLDQEVGA